MTTFQELVDAAQVALLRAERRPATMARLRAAAMLWEPDAAPPPMTLETWEARLRACTIDRAAELWALSAHEFALLPGPTRMFIEASRDWHYDPDRGRWERRR